MDFFFKAILFNIFQGVGWVVLGVFFWIGQSSLCYPAAIVRHDRKLTDLLITTQLVNDQHHKGRSIPCGGTVQANLTDGLSTAESHTAPNCKS